MARPKKGIDGLPKNWKERVLVMYTDGASDVEVKAYLIEKIGSLSNDLWTRWMKEEPEFSETILKGRILSEAWWCKIARMNLNAKDFQTGLWYANMKNRFGWRDKQEISTSEGDFKIEIEMVKPDAD